MAVQTEVMVGLGSVGGKRWELAVNLSIIRSNFS